MRASIAENHEAGRDRWQQAKQAYPALALSTHQALRALGFEDKAECALTHVTPFTAEDAYRLCDILADFVRALEAWAYVSARLWYLCEIGQADAEITALHAASCEHYKRLLLRHLQVQQQTFLWCQEQQIILRLGVVTQALDMSQPPENKPTETDALLRGLPRAKQGEA